MRSQMTNMSNKINDTIAEYEYEKEQELLDNDYCKICGILLSDQDDMANMAVKFGDKDICRQCRHDLNVEIVNKKKEIYKK